MVFLLGWKLTLIFWNQDQNFFFFFFFLKYFGYFRRTSYINPYGLWFCNLKSSFSTHRSQIFFCIFYSILVLSYESPLYFKLASSEREEGSLGFLHDQVSFQQAILWIKGWKTFSVKGQIVNIWGFKGYATVSVATTKFFPFKVKAVTDNT